MLTQQFIHLIYENNVQIGILLDSNGSPVGIPMEGPR